MNHKPILPILVGLAGAVTAFGQGLDVKVNSTGNDNTPDDRLTFVEAVLIANERLGRPIAAGESSLVIKNSSRLLNVRFAIPGDGPHFITPPPGGFPPLATGLFDRVLIDGFSQPGARSNSNAIDGTNNAVLKIVLDCRKLAEDPAKGEMPDWSFKIASSHVHFRGFSVLAGRDTDNYGVYFSDGAVGGQISGCWFGVSPDQSILAGGEVAIAAYGTEGGQVFGSDGNGADDLAEINVIVAHAIGIQFEETKDILVQHNLIGVLPDGKTLPPENIREILEGDAVEGNALTGTITLRRNLMGGMRGDAIEFYGPAERLVLLENTIGVAWDGVTPLPNGNFLRVQTVQAVVGLDAGAAPTAASGNRIANHSGYLFRHTKAETRIVHRGNVLTNNTGPYSEQLANSLAGMRLGRETDLAPVLGANSTRQVLRGNLPLSGPGPNALTAAIVDIYASEQSPDPEHPPIGRWLASFTDGGPGDLDPSPGAFTFDLSAVPGLDGATHLAVTSTLKDATGADTSPFSNVLRLPPGAPRLSLARTGDGITLTLNTTEGTRYQLQSSPALGSAWTNVGSAFIGTGSSKSLALPRNGAAAFFRVSLAN
ncbi:MAG: hypothetical protein FJW38_31500 [Acidobacteria bacterium]|nr:hypothetical protein [Acidobacteriota bacterium]